MSDLRRPVALLGGTFDPIHFGHLRLAEEAADRLGLDRVRLVPAGQPPHRGAPGASAADRLAMARLAVAGNPRLAVDDREVLADRRSYTITTLEALRAELGATPLCLLVGADAFLGLPTWHRWEAILATAHVVVATRPGHDIASRLPDALAPLWARARVADPADLAARPAGHIYPFDMTPLDISATRIRALAGVGASIRYLVPDAVAEYVASHRLYRPA